LLLWEKYSYKRNSLVVDVGRVVVFVVAVVVVITCFVFYFHFQRISDERKQAKKTLKDFSFSFSQCSKAPPWDTPITNPENCSLTAWETRSER
jgi:hypothetical protein